MTHWYDKEGNQHYGATLKEARKNGYLPSITTVDKIIANEGLEIWKVNQAIMSALTLERFIALDPRLAKRDGYDAYESDEDYIKRIKSDSMAQARKAARMGNVLHKMAERYASNKPLFFHGQREDVWNCFEPVKEWIDNNLTEGFPEKVLVGEGYAGKCDFLGWGWCNLTPILLDYKSTFIKPTDIKKDGTIKKAKIYDSWGRQLAALNKVANADIVMSVIISTNPDFTGVWTYEWSSEELDRAWLQLESAVKIYRSIKRL